MDELLRGADFAKLAYSDYCDRLKASISIPATPRVIESLTDEYLEAFNAEDVPDGVEKALYIGERKVTIPDDSAALENIIKEESDRLIRVELAELAQDPEIQKSVEGIADPLADIYITDDDAKKLKYIEAEIAFGLKMEMAKENPERAATIDEAELVEPKDEERIAANSLIVDSFLEDIVALPTETSNLDTAETYQTPFKPTHDVLSFVPTLIADNLYVIHMRPVVNEQAEIEDAKEVWEKAVDSKNVTKSMKYDRFAVNSIGPGNLSGTGLQVSLDIDKLSQIQKIDHGDEQIEETKFADIKVLLAIEPNSTGRWPQIIERQPETVTTSEPIAAPTIAVDNVGVFDLMDFLADQNAPTTIAADSIENSTDASSFIKKKKRKKQILEEIITPEVEATAKIIEQGAAADEPKAPIFSEKFEFAKILDISKDSAEYIKMKHNLARTYSFDLDPFQQQAIVAMENGNSVFVAAHTSAGKTVVAEYAIALGRKHRSRVVYTSPIKALSNQKFRDFKNEFEDVGLITGDIQLNTEASCLVMTTEILKSMLYNGRVSPDELEWVIFDEVHYINDAERGHVWEEVLIMLPTQVNIVMLSATVPNCLEFADWVGRIKNRTIYVVQTLMRPVPLAHHLYSGKDKKTQNEFFEIMGRSGEFNMPNFKKAQLAQAEQRSKKQGPGGRGGKVNHGFINNAVERCYYTTLINFLKERNLLPVVNFIFSRNRCNQFAQMLYKLDLTTKDEKAAVKRLFTKYLDSFKGSDRNLPQVLQMQLYCYHGFAIHHSGILPILKELVEILFQKGYVKFLFATETFAMGVNMPARTVVFDAISKFDGTERRPLNCTEYIQMAGRAGRRGIDDTGLVIIMAKAPQPYEVTTLQLMLRGKPVSLESKFRITYNMLLNILRTEELNIEDMLQRSYVERVSLRSLASKQTEMSKIVEQIAAVPELHCRDCQPQEESLGSVEAYHDQLLRYIRERSFLLPTLIKIHGAGQLLTPGRYVLLTHPERGVAAFIAVVLSFKITAEGQCELNVVTLALDSSTNSKGNQIDAKSESAKNYFTEDFLFESAAINGLEVVVDVGQSRGKLELLRNFPLEWILAITKRRTKYVMEKDLNEYFQQQAVTTARRKSPSRSVDNLMTEMDSLIRSNSQQYNDSLFCKIGEDIAPRELGIHKQIGDFVKLRNVLLDESQFSCRQCIEFSNHLRLTRHLQVLRQKRDELSYQTSTQALLLSEDYGNCLKVLRELNFIDKDNLITIKGRVAAQINEDTLLLTELIFENKLQQRGCSEIAAMLCSLTAQHGATKDKSNERDCYISTTVANGDVINTLKSEIANMANKIDGIERKYGVSDARRGQDPTFGLMEAVYQWAEGMSFEQITHLTDAHEGIIVRCIQRLNEVLKDIRNAGRIIGDNTLVQKMIDTSAAIRRDIAFAASLYTTEDD